MPSTPRPSTSRFAPCTRSEAERVGLVAQSRLVRRVSALFLGIGVALLLAELGFRFLALGPPELITKRWLIDESRPGRLYHCYPSNPHREFDPVPDVTRGRWRLESALFEPEPIPLEELEDTPWCVEYRTSSQGLRDREYSNQPPEGVARILGVGDSFAVGEGVPVELGLFAQLDALLGEKTEVLNGAQPGVNTREELAILKRLRTRFHCRRALVVFVPNDIELNPELAASQDYINDLINIRAERLEEATRSNWIVEVSRLGRYLDMVSTMRKASRSTIAWYRDSYSPQRNEENLRRLSGYFREMTALPDCRVVLVLYPLLEGFTTDYPLGEVHRRVSDLAVEAGLPVLDLAPVFSGIEPSELWVHPVDHHPNGRAHGLAAKAIVEWLTRDHPDFLESEP